MPGHALRHPRRDSVRAACTAISDEIRALISHAAHNSRNDTETPEETPATCAPPRDAWPPPSDHAGGRRSDTGPSGRRPRMAHRLGGEVGSMIDILAPVFLVVCSAGDAEDDRDPMPSTRGTR
jgi:hypothetical protein